MDYSDEVSAVAISDEASPQKSRKELNVIAEDLLDRVRRNDSTLTSLDVSDILFAKKFYKLFALQLRHNTFLKELHLNNCKLCDDDVQTILLSGFMRSTALSQLQVLSLESNEIQNVGLGYISACIKEQGTKYGRRHAGVPALDFGGPKSRGIRALSLRSNRLLGSDGVRRLVEALQKNMTVEVLNLADNEIDPYGAGWLASLLRNSNMIKSLDVRGNPISSHGVEEFVLACESADANLILAEDSQFAVRVCGNRTTCVYCDGQPLELCEDPEAFQEYIDSCFKRSGTRVRTASAVMKQISDTEFVPAMGRWGKERAPKDLHEDLTIDPYQSIKLPKTDYCPIKRKDLGVDEVSHNKTSTAPTTKEACTVLTKTRLKHKPGLAYYF